MFDPDGCSGRLYGCLFLGEQRPLPRERVRLGRCDGNRGLNVFAECRIIPSYFKKGKQHAVISLRPEPTGPSSGSTKLDGTRL